MNYEGRPSSGRPRPDAAPSTAHISALQFLSTSALPHCTKLFNTLQKSLGILKKESHSCCKLRVVWASCSEPAGYRPEGQKEPSPGFHAHRWNQALVSMCTNRTKPWSSNPKIEPSPGPHADYPQIEPSQFRDRFGFQANSDMRKAEGTKWGLLGLVKELELWNWILKNLIKVGCPSRFKSFLSDFITGRKPLLLLSF